MVVLLALRDRARHGYEITKELERLSRGQIVMQAGTLYPILHKLERKELIVSDWQMGPEERPRRVYSLTENGRTEVERQVTEWIEFAAALTGVIEGTGGAQPA